MIHLLRTNDISDIKANDYLKVISDTSAKEIIVKRVDPFNGYEYVDLGIKNEDGKTIYFATMNVGAESESDYGLYFQYGDTVGYTDSDAASHSSWSTSPVNGGNEKANADVVKTYNGTVYVDNILTPEYDPAHLHMGGKWRTPTRTELLLLINNTSYSALSTVNGVKGRYLTSTIGGYTDKKIFIPAAGLYNSGNKIQVGNYCFVMSSEIDGTSYLGVGGIEIDSKYAIQNLTISQAMPIRAVLVK